jgi:hypothetical protein
VRLETAVFEISNNFHPLFYPPKPIYSDDIASNVSALKFIPNTADVPRTSTPRIYLITIYNTVTHTPNSRQRPKYAYAAIEPASQGVFYVVRMYSLSGNEPISTHSRQQKTVFSMGLLQLS